METSPSSPALSPKQHGILQALLAGHTISEAAELGGVHRSTVYHWCRHDTVFAAAWRDAQSQQAAIILDSFRRLASRALETLESLMTGPSVPASVRLKAATFILQAVLAADPYARTEPRLTTATVDHVMTSASVVAAKDSAAAAPRTGDARAAATPAHHARAA